jgi:hypothetical protein
MDALAEQQSGGLAILGCAMFCIALGAWVARTGNMRWINGVDFSRIDPRDHPRAAAIVGQSVAAIGVAYLPLGAFLAAASAPIRQEWIPVLAVLLPVVGSLCMMYLRLQGLYRR